MKELKKKVIKKKVMKKKVEKEKKLIEEENKVEFHPKKGVFIFKKSFCVQCNKIFERISRFSRLCDKCKAKNTITRLINLRRVAKERTLKREKMKDAIKAAEIRKIKNKR